MNDVPDILTDEVQRVPIDSVREHPENPRDGDVGEIQKSIRQNGFFGALVVQESSGKILVGNHRYLAAQAEGLKEVPVIYVDVGDEEALRILLADNRTSDIAGYHDDQLLQLLDHLNTTQDELQGTGYDEQDLADLRALAEPPTLDELEDEYGEPDPEELWPKISVKVPPDVEEKYEELMGEMDGDTDAKRFENLLDNVEPNGRN